MNTDVKRSTFGLLSAALVVVAGSCIGSQPDDDLRPNAREINPGEVRVASTVVSIDTVRSGRADDPCARYPCYATIRIDSILGYGSGFPRPLSPGESLRARFAFTLAPSADAMPGYEPPLPGLEEGVSFQADLRGHLAPGLGARDPTFIVYNYRTENDAGVD